MSVHSRYRIQMKHLKSISSGIQSVAKLTILFLLWARVSFAADAPSPFAPIVGVWNTHLSAGWDREFSIGSDGSVTLTDVHGTEKGRLAVQNGQFLADFGDRWMVFYKTGEDVLKVEIFNPKSRLDKGEPSTTGTGHRVVAAAVNAPAPSAPPIGIETKTIIHSLGDILASADTTKPFKPYDMVDTKLLGQINKALFAIRGKEIDLSFQAQEAAKRGSETQFRWKVDSVESGNNRFTTYLTLRIPTELVPTALAIGPGRSAKVHGVVESAAVSYGNGPMLYVSVQATSLSTGNHDIAEKAPTPATTSTAPAPTSPQKTIQLDKAWDTPMQGGTATINDLGRLFGTLAKPNADLSATTDAAIYDQITYLMPVRQAIESLKLNVRVPSKVLIACPGFPRDSLYYYAIDGRFEGTYNRMYLVVDRADQVVSVELVDETPKLTGWHSHEDQGWHTYDFVNARAKALSTLRVEQHVALWTVTKFEENNDIFAFAPIISTKNAGWKVARVDSALLTTDKYGQAKTSKQNSRWYVPRPLVELILTCVQKAGTR